MKDSNRLGQGEYPGLVALAGWRLQTTAFGCGCLTNQTRSEANCSENGSAHQYQSSLRLGTACAACRVAACRDPRTNQLACSASGSSVSAVCQRR